MRKSLCSMAILATMFFANNSLYAQDVPTVTQDWFTIETGNTDAYRFGTGWDGKVYIPNKTSKKIEIWDQSGKIDEIDASSTGLAVNMTRDDAGNLIYHPSWANTTGLDCTNLYIYNQETKQFTNLTLTLPEGAVGARMDVIGRAIGNVLSDEGGFLVFTPNTATKPYLIKIANGKQVEIKVGSSGPDTFDGSTLAQFICSYDEFIKLGDDWLKGIAIRKRLSYEPSTFDGVKWNTLPAASSRKTVDGFDIFTLGDILYEVVPSGKASYTTRFAIINTKTKEEIYSSPEENEYGISSQGFGSITANKIDEYTVQILVVGQTHNDAKTMYNGCYTVSIPKMTVKSVEISNITYKSADFTVEYDESDVPENADVTVVVSDKEKGKTESFKATENPFTFTMTGLEGSTTYNFAVTLEARNADGLLVRGSDATEKEVITETAPIVNVKSITESNIDYKSGEITVEYETDLLPEGTEVTLSLKDNTLGTVRKVSPTESPVTFNIDKLEPKTAYKYTATLTAVNKDEEINLESVKSITVTTAEHSFTQTSDKAHHAYNLSFEAVEGESNQYVVKYHSTGAAEKAVLVMTPAKARGAEQIEVEMGEVNEGENTYTLDTSGLESGSYQWAVRIHNYPVTNSAVSSPINVGGARAAVACFTDPEYPEVYGYTVIGRATNTGIDVYDPQGKLVKSAIYPNCAAFGGSKATNPMDATTRGTEVYFASWNDQGYGVAAFDLAAELEGAGSEPYSVFVGTKASSGLITNDAGEAVGSGTPCVGVWGKGEETSIVVFDEDAFGNKLAKNVIGENKTTSNALELIGEGFHAELINTNVGVKCVENGIFVTQIRADAKEATTSGLRYISMPKGESLWHIGDASDLDEIPESISSVAGVDVNYAGDKIAVSTYDGIYVYDLSWRNENEEVSEVKTLDETTPTMVPVLKIAKIIPYPNNGRVTTRVNVCFDAAGNIHALSQAQGYFTAAVGNYEPVVTTPANSVSIMEVTTGVENIAADADNDGEAVYYNLNGVRVDGNNMPAGIYVKVVGKTATKVVVK